jgi:hypothetical protein
MIKEHDMGNLRVDLPLGVTGKHFNDGYCIDCSAVSSVYDTVDGPVVVHQGRYCRGFVKRFTKSEKSPHPTLAIDESGEWVELPSDAVLERGSRLLPSDVKRAPSKEVPVKKEPDKG